MRASGMRLRVLVVGASGYVGGAIWQRLRHAHDVVGTCHSRRVDGLVPLDLRDEGSVRRLAAQGFDVVVHAAGLVDLGAVAADPELAWVLNVRSVEVLLDTLAERGGKLVYLSSDNVFDGTKEAYTEGDPTSPINHYGRTKVAAEERVLAGGTGVVIRIPIVFGPGPWCDRFLARFCGATTPAQTDVVCAPVYLPGFAGAFDRLWGLSGVVHYGGAEILTRFELASRFARALRLPTEVVPVTDDEATAGYRRPKRLVLRSTRQPLLGPGLDEALHHLRHLVHRPVPGAP